MDQQLLDQLKAEYHALLEQGRLSDALLLIRQAAHWADEESQILAERIYLHGAYGHLRQDPAGYEYAMLAAMNGDVTSMYDLAYLYREGKGTVHDAAKAFYWLSKAADAGDAKAMDELGLCYLQARGVERDLNQAAALFEKAREAAGQDADLLKSVDKHLFMAQKMIEKEINKKAED